MATDSHPTGEHRSIDGWLRSTVEDAERRGLPELKPLLEALARATAGLREADRQAREAEAGEQARRDRHDG
jgi:hypothetical protein